MTNDDASKHLGGREGKQQTMKTNTKQGAAYTTWARFAPCVLHFQDHSLDFYVCIIIKRFPPAVSWP